jgi:FkbM family methyltransferase
MLKKLIKQLAISAGYTISRVPDWGANPLNDMRKVLRNSHPLIFDVGANIGQSVRWFRSAYPTSEIHSFEPSPSTFEILKSTTSGPHTHLWNYAIGASPGQLELQENESSDMSSFLPVGESGWGEVIRRTSVTMQTIDQFCSDHQIGHIDILKSDTQGYDLEVFAGAERMFAQKKVSLVFSEINFLEIYRGQASFGKIYDFLYRNDFRLLSFYNISRRGGLAGWTDGLFVHNAFMSDVNLHP